jgi:hypothetical protein
LIEENNQSETELEQKAYQSVVFTADEEEEDSETCTFHL